MFTLFQSLLQYFTFFCIACLVGLDKSITVDWNIVRLVLSKNEVWFGASNFFYNFLTFLLISWFSSIMVATTFFVCFVVGRIKCVALSKWQIAFFQTFCQLSPNLFTVSLVVVREFLLGKVVCIRALTMKDLWPSINVEILTGGFRV